MSRRRAGVMQAVMAGCVAACPLSLQAQQRIEERIVVTASASPAPEGDLGRAVVIVTREDLARLPMLSVADVLRLASSVDVRSRGPQGVQTDFSVRGASFGQALVLVDGVRMNDAQSGHHNSDLPVTLDDIERVEVLLGAGSSLHGADALGGTINIITRQPSPRYSAEVTAGADELVTGSGAFGVRHGGSTHVISGSFDRSGGFMPERDYDIKLARYRGALGRETSLSLGVVDKEFGANGFYGPAPSREWTDQTAATFERRFARANAWQAAVDLSYRTHGDRFIYDVTRPSLSQNDHRTHAIAANLRWHQAVNPRMSWTVGGGGGRDVIDSTNLGDRDVARGNAFVEGRGRVAGVLVSPGLRVDAYSRFGTSWSPSVAVSGWAAPRVKWRGSAGHSFRIPTFTELYYRDPNHQASSTLRPEEGWSADLGADVYGTDWSMSGSVFGRFEENAIDWVRQTSSDPWRTANVRRVETAGAEVSLAKQIERHTRLGVQYTWLTSDAGNLAQLSKYVLDYARHSLAAAAGLTWDRVSLGQRLEYKRRVDGRAYWIWDVRLGRRFGRVEAFGDVSNLLDTEYQEVPGVAMPGRWLRGGIRVR